jgi:hypothetical protein
MYMQKGQLLAPWREECGSVLWTVPRLRWPLPRLLVTHAPPPGPARGCQPDRCMGAGLGAGPGRRFPAKKLTKCPRSESPQLRVPGGPEVQLEPLKFQVSSWSLIMSVRFNAKPGPHCRCSAQAAAQSTVPPVAPAAWSCGALLVLVLDRDSDAAGGVTVQYRGPLTALPACAALGLAGIPKRCVGPTLICALLAESCASRRQNKKCLKD